MKYGYLKKILCISIASAMIAEGAIPLSAEVFTGPAVEGGSGELGTEGAPVSDGGGVDYGTGIEEIIDDSGDAMEEDDSEDDGELVVDDDEIPGPTPVPEPTTVPSEEPAVTPEPEEPAVTPESPTAPEDDGELIEPEEETEIPEEVPEIPVEDEEIEEEVEEEDETEDEITEIEKDAVQDLIDRIDALKDAEITEADRPEIESIRAAYDALSDEDKARVTNYDVLLSLEQKLLDLDDDEGELSVDDGEITAIEGAPVYYTDMVSNLHAGKEFYLNSLKDNYAISFSDDFSEVMDEIEAEYKEKYKLVDLSDVEDSLTTISGDTLLVRNWQDILAVYIYEETKKGKTEFDLSRDDKEELSRIFAEMNPVVRSKVNETRTAFGDRHINYYIKKNNIDKEDREILKKYVETDCKLLCAVVTASRGFVRESVGEDVSEERVNVITAAYSLVGKVGYFWGGKSVELGEDPSWGTAEKVTAEGSTSTGTTRAYGLDCSGFVTWAVVNGYQDKGMQETIGDGTTDQWLKANVVAEADAQPGDLVFQKGPESGSNNHVGILCGKTDAGDWIAIHCSSGKNGVTVGEAYGASFRYIRQPDFYPTEEEVQDMLQIELEDGGLEDGASLPYDTYDEDEYFDEDFIYGLIDNSVVESFDVVSSGELETEDLPSDLDAVWELDDSTVEETIPEEPDEPVLLIDDSIVELF